MNTQTTGGEERTCPGCGGKLQADGLCLHCAAQIAFGEGLEAPGALPTSLGKIRYFGDYELLEEIARGGMGVVYRAVQLSLNRPVAVKLMLHGALAATIEVERFYEEAKAAASLQHPGIVAIHEVGECDGQVYFSMDFVLGKNMEELCRAGPLPAGRAAKLMAAVARAVDYAHRRGVLHRDIKPSNVLVDTADIPHVTDFGLAKRLQGDASLTQAGQVFGTPGYMAPEQASGAENAAKVTADVYSLGALLYYLLTARAPFVGPSMGDVLRQVTDAEPVELRLLNPEVPVDLETLCLKCLAKDPAARYATAADLADELERYLRNEPIQARPITWAGRAWRWARRKPAIASLTTAVSALVLSVAIGSTIAATRLERARLQQLELRKESDARLHQGERLIDFMLGDLADRLDPVGRLDLMDATIAEVNKFYAEAPVRTVTPEQEHNRARALHRIANVRSAQGRFPEAHSSYALSIAAYEELSRKFPDNAEFPLETALTLNDEGWSYGNQSDLANSAAAFERSLNLLRQAGERQPASLALRLQFAKSAHNLAICQRRLNNPARSEELLAAAEKAVRACMAADPRDAKARQTLSIILGTSGQLLRQLKRPEEALSRYDDNIQLMRELVELEPKNMDFRYSLAQALSSPGPVLIDLNRFHEAQSSLAQAADLIDQLVAGDPSNLNWQRVRINILTNLGTAYCGDNDNARGLALFRRIWELTEAKPEVLKTIPKWALDVSTVAWNAADLLHGLAEQDRKAGHAARAAEEEKEAELWDARYKTLAAPASSP